MTSVEHTIEVLGDDGELSEVERTTWRSHYGPMLDFPGVGWSDSTAITFRDANIDNDEFIEQYLEMVQVEDLDELIALHEEYNGVPLFNTVATSSDGRAWYADTSATPTLSDEALAAYETSLETDPLAAGAADSGAVLLDGSDPLFEWVELEGARDPGLVPYADQPVVERSDYVFNANDSFWMPHATELLEGDYSPLHGEQRTPRSPRTRENATVLDDTGPDGAAGEDGSFDLDELADAALANRGFTARALLDEVVARCDGAAPVSVEELPAPEPEEGETPEDLPGALPAGEVDVAPACEVLAGWDGVYDLDRAGPPIFREMISRFERDDLGDAGPLWAEPFDPAQPLATPSGLAPAPADGTDPVLSALARAVQVLEAAEVDLDATLGELQQAERNGTLVPDPRRHRDRRDHQHRRMGHGVGHRRPGARRARTNPDRARQPDLRGDRRRDHDRRLPDQQRHVVPVGRRADPRRSRGEVVPHLREHRRPLEPRLPRGHRALLGQGLA